MVKGGSIMKLSKKQLDNITLAAQGVLGAAIILMSAVNTAKVQSTHAKKLAKKNVKELGKLQKQEYKAKSQIMRQKYKGKVARVKKKNKKI